MEDKGIQVIIRDAPQYSESKDMCHTEVFLDSFGREIYQYEALAQKLMSFLFKNSGNFSLEVTHFNTKI